jgi:hypothetical protein
MIKFRLFSGSVTRFHTYVDTTFRRYWLQMTSSPSYESHYISKALPVRSSSTSVHSAVCTQNPRIPTSENNVVVISIKLLAAREVSAIAVDIGALRLDVCNI